MKTRTQLVSLAAMILTGLGGNVLIPAASCAEPPPVTNPLDYGLVAYYPFNGNASDASGNGNHGAVIGSTPTADRWGDANSAYAFDGLDDYIDIGASPSLKMTEGLSISVWINVASLSESAQNIISDHGPNEVTEGPGKMLRFIYDDLQFHVDGVYGYRTAVYVDYPFTGSMLGTWQHVVGTYDRNTVRLYVNGVEVATQPYSQPLRVTSNPVLIGASGFGEFLQGSMDELRIYNRALTASEVAQLFVAQGPAPAITSQPQSQTVTVGASTTLVVTATGTPPLSYQWYKGGVPLPGQSGTTLTLASVQARDAGSYAVLVSNPYGTAASQVAVLTVTPGNGCSGQDISWQQIFGGVLNGETYRGLYSGGYAYTRVAFVDIDGDGDSDLFVTSYPNGRIDFYRNDGTTADPEWTLVTNFYGGIPGTRIAALAFADIDGDGDYDLFYGTHDGVIRFYRNIGTRQTAAWTLETGSYNSIDVGDLASPAFADIDKDGDLDLFVGNSVGDIAYYRNDGDRTQANWTLVPTDYIKRYSGYLVPVLGDVDGDGDLDLFVTSYWGADFFRNVGNLSSPSWHFEYTINSFVAGYTAPALVDIDNDGDLDLFVAGSGYAGGLGCLDFFRNEGTSNDPQWTLATRNYTRTMKFYEGWTAPALVDIDNDGDYDLFVGHNKNIAFFRNDGTRSDPRWTLVAYAIESIHPGGHMRPTFADIDGDGDYDLFIGGSAGKITFYQNDGTPTSPVWTFITDNYGSIDLATLGGEVAPTFVDIDNDGDYDLFIGTGGGKVVFYRNVSLRNVPSWARELGNDIVVLNGPRQVPSFIDIDCDGDFDLVSGGRDGKIALYRNRGSAIVPSWERASADFAARGVELGECTPCFVDIDGDGDFDVFMGDETGGLNCLRNLAIESHLPDTEVPTIAAPAPVVANADPGGCEASNVALGTPATADNRGVASVVNNAPAVFAKGTTTVTWTVTDTSGNTATATQTVTVNDTEIPSLTAPPAVMRDTDAGKCEAGNVTLGTPLAADNCGVASVVNNAPAIFAKGTTTVTWTVTDTSGNTATATQTVTVNDTEIPSLAAPPAVVRDTDVGKCEASNVTLGTPVTADNCAVASVVNNAPAVFPKGRTTVIWSATDASGNQNTATQMVTVEDHEKPAITAPAAVTVNTDAGKCEASNVPLGTPVTADNCGVASVINDAPAAFPKGTTIVTWTVTDSSGNSATATQAVTVQDSEAPIIAAPPAVTVNADPGQCSAAVHFSLPIASDNCPGVAVDCTPTCDSTFPKGATPVNCTATDAAGNSAIASFTVTVVDATPPMINAISAAADPVLVGTSVNVRAGFADNCGVGTATWNWGDGTSSSGVINPVSGEITGSHVYAVPGVYTLTLTVTDQSGNSANSSFQYIVVYDPEGGFVTGGGWINSPPGAYPADASLTGKATFGFVSKYQKGANVPTGQTEFQFKVANLNFRSTAYQWLVVAGAKAQYKGSGTINGTGDYRFMLSAIDGQINGGGGVDKFRIKIWDSASGLVVYDNQLAAPEGADPTTAIQGGSIVIHKE